MLVYLRCNKSRCLIKNRINYASCTLVHAGRTRAPHRPRCPASFPVGALLEPFTPFFLLPFSTLFTAARKSRRRQTGRPSPYCAQVKLLLAQQTATVGRNVGSLQEDKRGDLQRLLNLSITALTCIPESLLSYTYLFIYSSLTFKLKRNNALLGG